MESEDEGSSGSTRMCNSIRKRGKLPKNILLILKSKIIREVVDQTTAFGIYEKLYDMYHNNSLMNRLYQKQRLYTVRMSESSQVKDHLDNFNHIILDLHGVDMKIEDEDQVLILIFSLLNLYKNFVDTILYGRITITVKYVKDSIMSKEVKRNVSVGEEVSSSSLSAGGGRIKEKKEGNRGGSH